MRKSGGGNNEYDLIPVQKRRLEAELQKSIQQATIGQVCSQDISKTLSTPSLTPSNVSWCQWALAPAPKGAGVQVGKSWGILKTDKESKERFDKLNCNVVASGKNPSCDDAWGDSHIHTWRKGKVESIKCGEKRPGSGSASGGASFGSKVECFDNANADRFCVLEKAKIDFSKMKTVVRSESQGYRTNTRVFEKDFLSIDCPAPTSSQAGSDGGLDTKFFPFPHLFSTLVTSPNAQCDYVMNGTVMLFSHDDISNLGVFVCVCV